MSEALVLEAMRLLRAMEEGNIPWDAADHQTADDLRALIRSEVPPAAAAELHRERADRLRTAGQIVGSTGSFGGVMGSDGRTKEWPVEPPAGENARLRDEVARLSEALADAETARATAVVEFEDAAQRVGRTERQLDACANATGSADPALEIPTTGAVWSAAYAEVLRLRVRYDAVVQAYLVPFDREKLDLVEADALRARGLEP